MNLIIYLKRFTNFESMNYKNKFFNYVMLINATRMI